MNVLVLCSANRCRSPMAAALLQAHADKAGADLQVSSAGFGPGGYPAEPEAVEVLDDLGLDLTGHCSRSLTCEMLAGAGLVVTMTKQHSIEAILVAPTAWPRTFPLRELVDRGRRAGPVTAAERLEDWVARVHAGRNRADLLAPGGDIADPIGQPVEEYVRTRDELDTLTGELAGLLVPLSAIQR